MIGWNHLLMMDGIHGSPAVRGRVETSLPYMRFRKSDENFGMAFLVVKQVAERW